MAQTTESAKRAMAKDVANISWRHVTSGNAGSAFDCTWAGIAGRHGEADVVSVGRRLRYTSRNRLPEGFKGGILLNAGFDQMTPNRPCLIS